MADTVLSIENVTKVYGNGPAITEALKDVTLKVERGEWIAITGPSGHGKSTLLQLMGGLDHPTTGSVYLDNLDITCLSQSDLTSLRRYKIGFVFQFFNLLPHLSALENVQMALWLGGLSKNLISRGMDLLDQVGLANKAGNLPNALSGGQQQKVAIARALANNPEILLMDEPTGNLDSVSEADFLDLLQRLHSAGKTIVVVTHNQVVAGRAGRLVR
ncbi:ABC transporter ATP-binding protein, partial [Sulfurirhabdus autotrophica]